MSSPGSNFPQLVSDLVGMQGQVQQYAPALSSTWGWLASQGKLLAAGQTASLSQTDWVSQYRAFLQQLQGAEPDQQGMVSQQFFQNIGTDAASGFPQAAQVLENEATDAANAVATSPVNPYNWGGAISTLEADAWAAVPWIAGGLLVVFVLPHIIDALANRKSA